MSKVLDVSPKLGEYMLRGWVLTDDICSQCSKIPLLRAPGHPVSWFCAACDCTFSQLPAPGGLPGPSRPQEVPNMPSSPSFTSSSHLTRASTPPTEVSDALSSPTFAPPVDTEEILRRRQQSDTASAEIGKRMLKGWAMLADECPNTHCYGIPLVRPPKAGGEKDPRKECVICSTVYVYEKDAMGQDRLVPVVSPVLREQVLQQPQVQPTLEPITVPRQQENAVQIISNMARPSPHAQMPRGSSSTYTALEISAQSLELSLHSLSDRLNSLSSSAVVEPTLIAQTAEAISKVSLALTQVKQLQWSEEQARGS
ncbi:hypothetical protein OBBRIDRAFT_724481 [Obba rivulosa]|uniref:Uncharacterized protein n=1 Tax=Obba rivulosa TaxID=1052685 RepID=A0A8E2J330_9APHY|nr:hypothetical protein OBBRIDRAFT_724481 [Obba rivulosa]